MAHPKHKPFACNLACKLQGSLIRHVANKELANFALSSSTDANLYFVHFLQLAQEVLEWNLS